MGMHFLKYYHRIKSLGSQNAGRETQIYMLIRMSQQKVLTAKQRWVPLQPSGQTQNETCSAVRVQQQVMLFIPGVSTTFLSMRLLRNYGSSVKR